MAPLTRFTPAPIPGVRAVLALAGFLAVALLAAAAAAAPKIAVILIDPDVSSYERAFQEPRIIHERMYYENLGYRVAYQEANVKVMVSAIMDKRVEAISFFGHGMDPSQAGAQSSILKLPAATWRQTVFGALLRHYRKGGYPQQMSFQMASKGAQNFGFQVVRNHSCSSLIDTDIARQFVRPGGSYFGARSSYAPCPTPMALLSDVSWRLTEYRVPPGEIGCGVKTEHNFRQLLARDLYRDYYNGRWDKKYKQNDVRTSDIYKDLRDQVINANYGHIHYAGNIAIWKQRLACMDGCIMSTPHDLQVNRQASAAYKACLKDCAAKHKYLKCP
ncbi:MAG: hypothetical protein H6907_22200 [Hyphomicrobiales bacterium]|nr:hypothetical protein [Hyphomicrobiales bacterium]